MNRNLLLQFKVNDTEKKAVELMTRTEGRKVSEMLRECVREAAERRGLWPIPQPNQPATMQDRG